MANYCDFRTEPGEFMTGVLIEIFDPGKNNYLEYLQNNSNATGAEQLINPNDRRWRGVFAYIAWGSVNAEGQAQFLEPSYVNWEWNYQEPPDKGYNAIRIWARKGVRGRFEIFTTSPRAVSADIVREPGAVLN